MKKNRVITLFTITGLSLVMVWLLLTQLHAARAAMTIRYVSADGNDSQACESIPHRCRTIQRAINVAAPLDEIHVATGLYTNTSGTVASITKTVTLFGGWNTGFTVRDPNAHSTRLDGQGNDCVVYIDGDISSTIDGFTITGGKAPQGGGIYIRHAATIVQNNIITNNLTTDAGSYEDGQGGGIYVEDAADTVILGNLIVSNTSGYGGGIYHQGSAPITITANTIAGNHATERAGGILIERTPDVVRGNTISDNVSDGDGGGMLIWDAAPKVEANLIWGNYAKHGGGAISLGNGAEPSLYNNQMVDNARDGLLVGSSRPLVVNNTIVGSGLVDSRYGISLWSSGDCTPPYCTTGEYINNIITNYVTGIYGTGVITPVMDYNDVWGNTTANYQLPSGVATGTHNLSMNPQFVNPAGGDYHLQVTSPCVNTGDPAGVPPAPPLDIDRDPRPTGIRVDIGADEYAIHRYLPLIVRH